MQRSLAIGNPFWRWAGYCRLVALPTILCAGDACFGDAIHSQQAAVKLDDYLGLATRLVAAGEADWSENHWRKPSHLLACLKMACEVRAAVANCRHDCAARRQAFEEHVRGLRNFYDRIEQQYGGASSPNDNEILDLAAVRLAEACADLAADLGQPAAQLANARTRVEWADALAYANLNAYHTASLLSVKDDLEARGEPVFARVALARLTRDCSGLRERWALFYEQAYWTYRKVDALRAEEAFGGSEENLAEAGRAAFWAAAEQARLTGQRCLELEYRRQAVAWDHRLVAGVSSAWEERRQTVDDVWRSQMLLADDRLALARLTGNVAEAADARVELLRAAGEICSRAQEHRSKVFGPELPKFPEFEAIYAQCALGLAEMTLGRAKSAPSLCQPAIGFQCCNRH